MLANQWPTWAGRQELQVCDHKRTMKTWHSLIPPKPKSFKLKGWTEKNCRVEGMGSSWFRRIHVGQSMAHLGRDAGIR
jgi:hypothetical protein